MALNPAIPPSPPRSHLCLSSINPNLRTLQGPYYRRAIPITRKDSTSYSSIFVFLRVSRGSPSCNSAGPSVLKISGTLEPRRSTLLQLAAPVVFFFVGLGAARACELRSHTICPATATAENTDLKSRKLEGVGNAFAVSSAPVPSHTIISESFDLDARKHTEDDKELEREFEKWKSKTFALTVPLKVVSLRNSIPTAWFKDFSRSQGRRARIVSEFRGSLNSIFSELSSVMKTGRLEPKSAMAADIVSVGDSWLGSLISGGLIEPLQGVIEQGWSKDLGNRWKMFICRNNKGELDSEGTIWGVPYRWGCTVIAFKKSKFTKHNLAPIEDWGDLWRPELAGKISMVDSPREVVGAVLKYMGTSYNTKDINNQVAGGRNAALENLRLLQQQVRIFDNVDYLKAFKAGDVWVAVGWSNDVLPAAKSMSDVAVIVPKSGTSLWADLWVIPATTRFATDQIGGRARGPSPLVHQWIEFCLQDARGLPFEKELLPGAPPFALERLPISRPEEFHKGPKLDTNLTGGVPPAEILRRCEFLEPLPENTIMDYQWLIAHMQQPSQGWIKRIGDCMFSAIQRLRSPTPSS